MDSGGHLKILAIETSCDEAGIAIVSGEKTADGFAFEVFGNALFSQATLHAEYGGVYPTLAKREHQKNLPILLDHVLEQFRKVTPSLWKESPCGIDAIAVTEGPGLEPALWTGITFAQDLSKKWEKPLFGVNHMEGHLISSLASPAIAESGGGTRNNWYLQNPKFPILALLISGGHTQFIESTDWFKYRIIGETLDDAVGECFDKVARMLGLPYPGGPEISRLADHARTLELISSVQLPRPMLQHPGCDVSFSGLKTAALYALRDIGGAEKLSEEEKAAFAREFEDAVAEVFVAKTKRALQETDAHTFVSGGGVAANIHLRESLVGMIQKNFPTIKIQLPDQSITGDNAIMIAEAALVHFLTENWNIKIPPVDIHADGSFSLA